MDGHALWNYLTGDHAHCLALISNEGDAVCFIGTYVRLIE